MNANRLTITKTHPDFKAFRWVAKARSKDPMRMLINCLNIEKEESGDSVVTATDGRRLHAARLKYTQEPGSYEIMKSTASELTAVTPIDTEGYPAWRKVIPKAEKPFSDWRKHTVLNKQDFKDSAFQMAIAVHSIAKSNFTLSFLLDAMPMGDWRLYQQDELEPILIQDADKWTRLAVVMPLRIAD